MPNISKAAEVALTADILLVIGTSLVVYPAASLIVYVNPEKPKYFIDPKAFQAGGIRNLEVIRETAGKGVPQLVDRLLSEPSE